MAIYDCTPDGGGSGSNYTAGDGIEINGQSISAKISTAPDNATQIYNGAIYTPATFQTTVSPTVVVTTNPATPSIQITATKGAASITAETNSEGVAELTITAFGTWDVSGTVDGELITVQVPVAQIQQYNTTLSNAHVFGVSWDTTNPSTQLVRLTPETDPNGVVTETVLEEPQPAVGTGAGSSPFDEFMPWAGMEQYNIIDGVVSYKKGDPGFSNTDYDTMVYIPPFYYRREQNGANQLFYVSNSNFNGGFLHPGSDCYISRYQLNSLYQSISGAVPLTNVLIGNSRTSVAQKGGGWSQLGYTTWSAIQILYLVEFADWDVQSAIAYGRNGPTSGPITSSGETDLMNYHTGSNLQPTDLTSCVQYRNIENLWANSTFWIDGYIGKNKTGYICENPSQYGDDSAYQSTGIMVSGDANRNYISSLGISTEFPFAMQPIANNGSSSTYIPDAIFSNSGNTVLLSGGIADSTDNYTITGLFHFHNYYNSFQTDQYAGARSIFSLKSN